MKKLFVILSLTLIVAVCTAAPAFAYGGDKGGLSCSCDGCARDPETNKCIYPPAAPPLTMEDVLDSLLRWIATTSEADEARFVVR